MLNTPVMPPEQHQCTPVYICTARQKGGGQPDRSILGVGWCEGTGLSDCCYQLKLSALHSHLTPHTSHQYWLKYSGEIPYLDIKLPHKLVKSSSSFFLSLSLSLYKHFTKLTIYTIRIILDSFLTKLNYVVN